MTEADVGEQHSESQRNTKSFFFFLLKKNPPYLISVGILSVYMIYSALALIDQGITGYNPSVNFSVTLQPPSVQYPFGTDDLGRNLFLKILAGAPIDAEVAVILIGLSLAIGLFSGTIAGYFGGLIDEIIMRVTDIFLAFPALVLAMAIAAALGPGLINSIAAIAVVWWPVYTRIARGETLSLKEQPFVLASRAAGVGRTHLVLSHIIPNVLNPMVAYATADAGNVIILFSVLGYLGLGVQPPGVDVGRIVFDGQNYIQSAPWYPLIPGIFLFVIVLCFALIGDLIRDYLDPKGR